MKKIFVLGMAVLLAFGMTLVSCGDDNGGEQTIYKLAATATDNNSNKQAVSITITDNGSRSARAIDLPEGSFPYIVEFGGIVISEGTVTVAGGDYTFTPSDGGTPFSFDDGTGTGEIPLSETVKKAIKDASGGLEPVLPDTLTMTELMELRSGGAYWDGTWCAADDNAAFIEDGSEKKIIFSGSNYTIEDADGETVESGTFVYTARDLSKGWEDPDSLFIFSRNVEIGPKMAVYFWEGGIGEAEIGIEDGEEEEDESQPRTVSGYLELTNWMYDPMEIATAAVRWFVLEEE